MAGAFAHDRVQDKVFGLATDFARYGWSREKDKRYQGLDRVVTEITLGAEYGYMKGNPLTICGGFLIKYKMMLDCRARGQPPTEALGQ